MYEKDTALFSIIGRCHSSWALYCPYWVGQTGMTTVAMSSNHVTIVSPQDFDFPSPIVTRLALA